MEAFGIPIKLVLLEVAAFTSEDIMIHKFSIQLPRNRKNLRVKSKDPDEITIRF